MRVHPIKTERGPEIRLETPDLLKRARFELSRHNPVLLRVSGSAMRPAIEDGDLLTVEPLNSIDMCPGDIVLFRSARDTALIHRVVRVEQRSRGQDLVARGDASAVLDVPVPAHHVMGRVTVIDRNGERIDVPPARRGPRAWLRDLLVLLGLGRA
jgi:signal peptidase I